MAEGWLRHLAGDRFTVHSAGTHPVGLNPLAVKVMREVGINITGHRSKSVEEFNGQPFDYVITVCDRAKESCPIWPGATVLLHWSFDDPAAVQGTEAERQQAFSLVRDEIAKHIQNFTSEAAAPTRRTDVTV
jgi:arsenate reductase (thioredoxin)